MDFARFPLIVIMCSCSFYILCVGFQCLFAFVIYFSKSFTRLLHLPMVFAPFPLVVVTFSGTFTVFFQHFYCIVMVCS